MKFQIFVQESLYKTVDINSKNILDVFAIIGRDIADGLVSNKNIKIIPVSEASSSSEYVSGSKITKDDGTVTKLSKKGKKWFVY